MRAEDHLALTNNQLKRVQAAWSDRPDWADLAVYGFYCLENAVSAAAVHVGIPFVKNHASKAQAAEQLHGDHGLPDVSQLLRDLNDARKAVAYGDVRFPSLRAETVVRLIEEYVRAVEELLGG